MALTFDDTQATALLGPLGLPADTTDAATIVATVVDALAADNLTNAAPSAIIAAAEKAGLEVIDPDTLTALRADATEGRQLKAAVERQRVEDVVNSAVNRGAITLARKEHWVNLIAADPAMAAVLKNTPDETAVPLTAIGHSNEPQDGKEHPDDGWNW
ncbi:hypothetical protein [Mycolicibacterium sp. HS_4_1]